MTFARGGKYKMRKRSTFPKARRQWALVDEGQCHEEQANSRGHLAVLSGPSADWARGLVSVTLQCVSKETEEASGLGEEHVQIPRRGRSHRCGWGVQQVPRSGGRFARRRKSQMVNHMEIMKTDEIASPLLWTLLKKTRLCLDTETWINKRAERSVQRQENQVFK